MADNPELSRYYPPTSENTALANSDLKGLAHAADLNGLIELESELAMLSRYNRIVSECDSTDDPYLTILSRCSTAKRDVAASKSRVLFARP